MGDADGAPGAAVIGLLLTLAAVVLGVKAARNRLPAWAARVWAEGFGWRARRFRPEI